MKYIAIKVEGIEHWFWFKAEAAVEENGRFIGKDGWGEGGARTDLNIDANLIRGRLESDQLQYR